MKELDRNELIEWLRSLQQDQPLCAPVSVRCPITEFFRAHGCRQALHVRQGVISERDFLGPFRKLPQWACDLSAEWREMAINSPKRRDLSTGVIGYATELMMTPQELLLASSLVSSNELSA